MYGAPIAANVFAGRIGAACIYYLFTYLLLTWKHLYSDHKHITGSAMERLSQQSPANRYILHV